MSEVLDTRLGRPAIRGPRRFGTEIHAKRSCGVACALDGTVDRSNALPRRVRQVLPSCASLPGERRPGALLFFRELGPLPAEAALRLGDRIPSWVRARIRSDANSATMARTLKRSRPAGSVGSWTEPPMLSLTSRRASSPTMSFASRRDRARRSSLVRPGYPRPRRRPALLGAPAVPGWHRSGPDL